MLAARSHTESVHVVHGDSTPDALRRAGIAGSIVVCADMLHEGPLLAVVDDDAWVEVRARFLVEAGYAVSLDETRRALARSEDEVRRALAGPERAAEVVLWFEHDVGGQLLLARLLGRLAASAEHAPVSRVAPGTWPPLPGATDLCALDADTLADLFTTRRPVTAGMAALGARAFAAACTPDPRALEAETAAATSELPFLAPALARFLAELPDVVAGLSATERLFLEVLALRGGEAQLVDAWRGVQAWDPHRHMADGAFARMVAGLAAPPAPLVAVTGPLARGGECFPATTRVALTGNGEACLGGRGDRAQASLDRWIGATHVTSPRPAFRWDAEHERVVPAR